MRIRLDSIGCRLNISEIEAMGRQFVSAGHRLVGPGEAADLYVFNTCAVTHVAARRSRQVVRQMRRHNPNAKVVVTGCYAELEPETIANLGADWVVGNDAKDTLPQLLAERGWLTDADPIPAIDAASFITLEESGPMHTRAFIKVQDGCDNRCTFCIVTIARGAGRSRSIADVVAEVQRLVGLGYQEAVLSGVHLGSFGHDRPKSGGLKALVEAILADTDMPRLRLSSLEPWDLAPDFFEAWRNPRLLPHLHLPLQSGSDEILRRMARRTSQEEFAALLESARAAIPDVSITTDVIVGFPGESEAEFAASYDFVEQMAFAKLHIFRFSAREGTTAAKMRGQIPSKVVQGRSQKLHALNADLEDTFRRRFVGRSLPVLWESSEPYGFGQQWSGLTGNYLRVVTQTANGVDLRNQVIETQLGDTVPGALVGALPEPWLSASPQLTVA